MKVLSLNSEYNGVGYWRNFEPARFLNMHSKNISVTYFPQAHYNDKTLDEWERLAKSHDLIIVSRVSDQESLTTILVAREISKTPIVMECDDDWLHVDKHNIAYKHWYPGSDCYKAAEAQCKWVDMFQVSTFPLKQAFYQFGKPTWISPNLIDIFKMSRVAEESFKKKKQNKNIRIGWAGSATHYGDFINSGILEALEVIAVKYPDVEFVFRGMKTDFFMEQKVEGKKDGRIIKYCFTDPKRIDSQNGGSFWDWPQLIADMNLDIVIVPLDDTKFNKAKSNCRYLEFSSLKIPGVYSPCYPYKETITHGVDGLLAKDKEEWIKYISMLIDDVSLRKEMARKAHKLVEEKYSLQNNIGIWAKNLEEMCDHAHRVGFQSYYSGDVNG